MSLHHLDPRLVGTAAALTDERRIAVYRKCGTKNDWYWHVVGGTLEWRLQMHSTPGAPWPNEQAALASARRAANLGHVAEKPCASYFGKLCPSTSQCMVRGKHEHDFVGGRRGQRRTFGDDECETCAWPRASHGAPA